MSSIDTAAAEVQRSVGKDAQIVDLGASSAGINLNLTDEGRSKLLDELVPGLLKLGFV